MAILTYELEVENSDDNRLNEIAVKVIVKNVGKSKATIFALYPSIPKSVFIEEKIDTFQLESRKRFRVLCEELSEIINRSLNFINKETIHEKVAILKADFDATRPKWFAFIKSSKRTNRLNSAIENVYNEYPYPNYIVANIEDARWGFDKWITMLSENSADKILYIGKLNQLQLLGKLDQKHPDHIDIDSGSFYSRTYVLKFYRRRISTKIYNISFDSIYYDIETSSEYRASVSTSINITPNPFFLTLFAVISSLLGTILKDSMDGKDNIERKSFFFKYQDLLLSKGIISIIIAILFFNIFEFTDIGKKIKIGVNWRTALIIGILSGLFGDRFIDAVKVLIGLGK